MESEQQLADPHERLASPSGLAKRLHALVKDELSLVQKGPIQVVKRRPKRKGDLLIEKPRKSDHVRGLRISLYEGFDGAADGAGSDGGFPAPPFTAPSRPERKPWGPFLQIILSTSSAVAT